MFLYFGKNSLFSKNVNVTYIFVCAEVLKLLMMANNWFWQGSINDMCLNVWKCVAVGIIKNGSVLGFWLWDLICKFQSTFVVITDFLCGKSIFLYSYTNFWSSEFVTLLFVKSSQDPRAQEISSCCFLFTFHWLSLQKGHFLSKTQL